MADGTSYLPHDAKELYEAYSDLRALTGYLGDGSLTRIIEATKRALINPQGAQAMALIQAIGRFENLIFGPPPDPEQGK